MKLISKPEQEVIDCYTGQPVRTYNGGILTPNPVDDLMTPIGYVELFAYHGLSIEKARTYAKAHPNEQVVCVGLEFPGMGVNVDNVRTVNYDALEFLKLLDSDSVSVIDVSIALENMQTLYEEARRVIRPGGFLVTFDYRKGLTLQEINECGLSFRKNVLEDLARAGFDRVDIIRRVRSFDQKSQWVSNRLGGLEKYTAHKY